MEKKLQIQAQELPRRSYKLDRDQVRGIFGGHFGEAGEVKFNRLFEPTSKEMSIYDRATNSSARVAKKKL